MHLAAILAPSSGAGSRSQGAGGRAASAAGRLAAGRASDTLCRPAPRSAARNRGPARVQAFARGFSLQDGTYERVLRYPDGKVRRIRYPLPPPVEEAACEDVTDGCWATQCWEPREAHWGGPPPGRAGGGAATLAPAAAAPPPAKPLAPAPGDFLAPQPPAEPERTQLPSSPMELLRFLNSPEHKASQELLWARVHGSYEVVIEVPWVAPRPLYLLAHAAPPADPSPPREQPALGLTYTLRTRVALGSAEAELSAVLRRRAPDGSPLIRCSEMRDGVVAFEDEADAERYGHMLEADGAAEVSVARCDSHSLFRGVQDVRGVVVLLRAGGAHLPQPHQLATSLRSGGGGGDRGPDFD